MLAASDPSILPPELGYALAAGQAAGDTRGGVLALVGPEYAMGAAFLALQGARDFRLQVQVQDQLWKRSAGSDKGSSVNSRGTRA